VTLVGAEDDQTSFSKLVLRDLWDSKLATSRSRGRDGVVPANLSGEKIELMIATVVGKIQDGSYTFGPYREVLRLRGSHKVPRVISIPTARDRLVMLALARTLGRQYSWIDKPRPQPLVMRVRQSMQTRKFSDFVRLDVKNFYPSIAHEPLMAELASSGTSPLVRKLTLAAISTPTLAVGAKVADAQGPICGVPVGTSIANILGEIALSVVDQELSAQTTWSYYRYVDDILVLTPHGQRQAARTLVAGNLAKLGLRAHPKSVPGKSSSGKIARDSFEYLGYTFASDRISVSRERRMRLIDHLVRPITAFIRELKEGSKSPAQLMERCEWWLNLRVTGCYSGKARRGWLPYYSQVDDMRVFYELDAIVGSFIKRLPAEYQFEPKSFVRAWTYVRNPERDRNGYILDFDVPWTERDMRDALKKAGHGVSRMTLEEVRAAFKKLVALAVSDLEQDVWGLS
jgi:RNA-directed DNA polymerase